MNERKARILQWPHGDSCPVRVGERFELQSCVIEITRVRESLKAADEEGRPRSLWIAEFTRHEEEKVFLLRSAPPAHADQEEQTDLDAAAIKKAAAESAYTSSQHGALPNEPESVGPDWEDKGRAKREKDRLDERKAAMSEAMLEMEAKKLAARAKQVVLERGRKGEDLTHLLSDVYERLACERKEAA